MKKTRFWSMLLICSMLMLTLAGTSYAEEQPQLISAPVDSDETADDSSDEDTEPSAKPEEEREILELAFNDADEAGWAVQAIGLMKSQAILSGYEDGNFRPNKPVSRVEAVVAAVRLMGLEDEAKAKSTEGKLAFADASDIDKKYKWAKGYIMVALEQGLFDTSESKLDPQKPASRVWVSALLVKSLGLEEEALALMTTIPEFKDVSAIPAGSIGYVNIAVEKGVITGYPDETFKPSRNVTRAELASLLVRTNDNLLEQAGAITVSGEVTAVSFETQQEEAAENEEAIVAAAAEESAVMKENATAEESAAADERATTDETAATEENAADEQAAEPNALGTITVESFNGETFTFKISGDLPVTYEDQFIPASELEVGDYVSLTAEDDVVLNASFIDKEEVNEATAGIQELEIELEIDKDNRMKLEYENEKGETKAKIEAKSESVMVKLSGDEAVQELEAILEAANLTPDMPEEEIVTQLLTALDLLDTPYRSFEVELKFSNGAKFEFESEQDDDEDDEDDEDHKQEDREGKGRSDGGKKR